MKQKLNLMRKDILIKSTNKNNYQSSTIFIPDNKENEDVKFYEVLQISDQVTMMKPGDVIILEFGKHTIPMIWNDVRCAVTSEDDVMVVLEKE